VASALAWLLLCLLVAGPSAAREAGTVHPALTQGSTTGAVLPRFASLRAAVVNLRHGPGQRYPIAWVYHRRGLPVEIVREFDVWRQVRTQDGTTGWVYHALLSARRGFLVTTKQSTLRREPRTDGRPVAHLQHGVVGHLLQCGVGAAWCRARVDGLSGYLPRAAFWGSYPGEAVGP
jgi:SH3-like domain-containing protein